jgi:hypothetical protein
MAIHIVINLIETMRSWHFTDTQFDWATGTCNTVNEDEILTA